jgi:hypothetical protein
MGVLYLGTSDKMHAKLEWFSCYELLVNTERITIGD